MLFYFAKKAFPSMNLKTLFNLKNHLQPAYFERRVFLVSKTKFRILILYLSAFSFLFSKNLGLFL